MAQHDHVAPDGTIWHSGPAAPITPPAPPPADGLTLLPADILAVRGITRVDPPLNEDWIVVTFRVLDRLGDAPGAYTSMVIGDRLLHVEEPIAEEIVVTVAAEPAVVEADADKGKGKGKDA